MTKNKGRRRRKNSRQHDEESVDSDCLGDSDSPRIPISGEEETLNQNATKKHHKNGNSSSTSNNNESDLGFADRRELQRKAAADKRRRKMKCHLCGKAGHVRRECPGIADDGRGESRYTKSHGDAGAVLLKGKKNHKKNNTTDNDSSKKSSHHHQLSLPPGFSKFMGKVHTQQHDSSNSNNTIDDDKPPHPFLYFDAGCNDGNSILEYLRFGRHGHGHSHGNGGTKTKHNNTTSSSNPYRSLSSSSNPHNHSQVSRKDAISEYDASLNHVCETTNFGGCIVRSFLPNNPCQAWNVPQSGESEEGFPFSWYQQNPSMLKFVVGVPFAPPESDNDDEHDEAVFERLVETANNHEGTVLGFFADLDYTFAVSSHTPSDAEDNNDNNNNNRLRSFQTQRLKSTLRAAATVDCPVQIRISPGYKPCPQSLGERDDHATDGYALAIRDLGTILLEASKDPWKVHLSCWNGKAEHLVALEQAFSSSKQQQQQLVVGFDGSLGFSKAIHLHESAFEVSLDTILLETGGPGIVPPVVAKHGGRNAFCHPGHLPFVAQELAKHAGSNPRNCHPRDDNNDGPNPEITAEYVARRASENTKAFYGWP